MIKQLAFIILAVAVALAGYGFFGVQRVVGYLYVFPAIFFLLVALVLFLVAYIVKKRHNK